jgi:hypothetical protein
MISLMTWMTSMADMALTTATRTSRLVLQKNAAIAVIAIIDSKFRIVYVVTDILFTLLAIGKLYLLSTGLKL